MKVFVNVAIISVCSLSLLAQPNTSEQTEAGPRGLVF